jgi:Holliday junction resolvase RusA-like endonuclease
MSVRQRSWSINGVEKTAWVVDFVDANGKRRLKTFKVKTDADRFQGMAAAARTGIVPEPLLPAKGFRPVEFVVTLPVDQRKKGNGREALVTALRAACPLPKPTADAVILHLILELPSRSTITNIDNRVKPILDALTGIAYVDDSQVCELMVRRVTARTRRLKIKLWHLPQTEILLHLNALKQVGLISDWGRA